MPFITQSMLLKALGWSLLNSFWQMALLWLLYLILTGMGNRFSSGTRHGLSLLLLGAGSVWFLTSFLNSAFGHTQHIAGAVDWTVSGTAFGIIYIIRDFFTVIVPYLALLYLGSLAFLLIPYIQNYRRVRELRFDGLCKMPAQLRIFAQSVSAQMGIGRKVEVWLSYLVDSPLTIGFFKPIILIPIATVNQLSLEQVESILLHVLAHIRRNDYLINLLVSWMSTLFFFNPFCRQLIHTVRKEREHCCDDLVIQFKYNPHAYASALLSLEKSRGHHATLALSAIGRSQQMLLERIRRFTGQPRRRPALNAKMTAFLLVNLMICPGLFFQPMPHSSPIDVARKTPASLELPKGTLISSIPPPALAVKARKPGKESKQNRPGRNTKNENNEFVMSWVSENDPLVLADGASTASTAVLSDDRNFSITMAPEETTDAPLYSLENGFPYVPKTSLVIQESADTVAPVNLLAGTNDPEARASMEKALLALNQINWKELEKNIQTSGKNLNPEMLRREVARALRQADWSKVNDQLSKMECDETIRSLIENIQLQTEALRMMHVRTKPAAVQLKLKIKENQLKLQQETIRKEIQIIQKQNETLSRGKRIVYI